MNIINWSTFWNNHWKKIGIVIVCVIFILNFIWQCNNPHKIINNIFDKWESQIITDYKAKQKESEKKIKELEKEKEILIKEKTALQKEREGIDNEITNIQRPKTYEETYKRFVKSGITPLDCTCNCKRK